MVTSCGASTTPPSTQIGVAPSTNDDPHSAWHPVPDPAADSLTAFAESESVEALPTQYLCQARLSAPGTAGSKTSDLQIVFVYPQVTEKDYLSVQVLVAGQARDYQAAFSTAGEESWWTLPVIRGIAPVVITQWAAIRTPAQERFTVAWSHAASAETDIMCEEMPWVSEL